METSSILQIVSLCIAILELEIQILVNQQENVTRWYSFFFTEDTKLIFDFME